ncbi:MAG: acetyl-CoA carboxylase, carboxyltransferase subunit beta [Chloroherpetonaceae bacterium]|nr:acetyl-CoA carboxylase, carboxyltransferase subunit beta [Chthonomonadaceae bacterium]MDW8206749.1 acetyl-CoA carboxylase, carboxyltransferase subunit beta [Chloroherpetonaceae bacterium]
MARGGWFRRPLRNGNRPAPVPGDLWTKCPRCGEISFTRDLERNLKVCPKCGYHHKLTARERIQMTVDPDSFEEIDAGVCSLDPLGFPEYAEKLMRAQQATGLCDAIVTGYARIEGYPLLLAAADFAFMGGSMGGALGEKVVRMMERAVRERLPVVVFTANGGGARMQEGLFSLMQMAKTSAGVALLHREAVPYIVVLTDPTMAGVYASFASLGDIILAEPGATIGFAGRRVGNQDLGVKLPDDFQTAEFQQRCGMVDRVVPRREMRGTLALLLGLLAEERAHAE